MLKKAAFSLLFSTSLSFSAFAGSVNVEPGGGYSGVGTTPTSLGAFSVGDNQIFGSNGSTAGIRDYVTFTVPNGLFLTQLVILNTTPLGNVGFIGLEAGNQLTLLPSTVTAAGLLGWHHYTSAEAAAQTNILPLMAVPANGSSGFIQPLGPGDYTLWIQDSSDSSVSGPFQYGFDVKLAVPEPATWGISLAALAGLALLAKRKNGSAAAR